jgi:hypothetical protein
MIDKIIGLCQYACMTASNSCQIVIGYNWINLCKTRIPIRLSILKIAMSPMTLGRQFTLLSKGFELSKTTLKQTVVAQCCIK